MPKTIYDRIEAEARPYLDTRENDSHVTVCYAAAKRLLASHPEAEPEIVLPAILLHDVGWKMVPEERQLTAFGPHAKDLAMRRFHETAGVEIARTILQSVGYDPEKTREILTIIDGHDSREEALSLNDALVKDADKLWRFVPVGFMVDCRRFNVDRRIYLVWLRRRIAEWLFTAAAREIAKEGLEEVAAILEREGEGTGP
jgi:hypothetical protein